MKNKDQKKEKIVYVDDGRKIADMSRIGRFGHVYSDAQMEAREKKKRAKEQKDDLQMTKEERKAVFRGGLSAALPAFLMLLAVAAAVFAIVWLWFKP